jgi:hypothetical protein
VDIQKKSTFIKWKVMKELVVDTKMMVSIADALNLNKFIVKVEWDLLLYSILYFTKVWFGNYHKEVKMERKEIAKIKKKLVGEEGVIGTYEEKEIGVVGVDAGQILICDPCYIDSEWEHEEYTMGKEKAKSNFSYNACCKASMKNSGQLNYKMGHPGVGVVTQSGYGDGCYPVIAKIEKETGRIKEIRVEFF